MVVFTCQNCNSCLKKKAVENHLYQCKNPVLTCIDCVKDFNSKSYVGHVTCVTENERYGGQSFVPSVSMQKQNQWCQAIQELLQRNISPPVLKNIVIYASENPNCPRNKKKFTNFILNNKTFKSKEAAESAFDLISEEYNKAVGDDSQGKNGETEKLVNGKRKTISETDVAEPTNENIEPNEKTSKKKNGKINGDIKHSNGVVENGQTNQKKNKKKDKKNNSGNSNDEIVPNGGTETDLTQSKKKKKKNKDKHRKNSETNEKNLEEEPLDESSGVINISENNQDEINENGKGDVDDSVEPPKDDEDLSKLSKKERKKLMKQKKYEAEVNSIENYKKEDEESQQPEEEQGEKRKKKKKKHLVEDEEVARQQKSSISEPEDKKIRLDAEPEEIVVEKPKKFTWEDVVVQLLKTQDDGEMSLKRLSKKVCAEYANVYGERESYEDVMLKFNKKVLKIPGVRIFKDRAKLLIES